MSGGICGEVEYKFGIFQVSLVHVRDRISIITQGIGIPGVGRPIGVIAARVRNPSRRGGWHWIRALLDLIYD